MKDLIERQAAIDTLQCQIEQCDKALGNFGISMKDEYAVKVERASLMAYKEQLEYLPSAQLDMSEYSDKLWKAAYERGKAEGREKRKKGHWIPQDHNMKYGMITTTAYFYPKCSRCGNMDNYTNFCSKCGADMRG